MKQIPPFRNRRDVFYLVHEEPTKESKNGIYIVKPKDNSYRAIWAVVWDVPLKLMSTSDGYTKEEVDKIISTIKDYQKENDKLLENIKLEISKLNSEKADRTELANVVAGLVPMGSVSNLAELETKPKRNNDSYYVEDQLSPEGNAYIYRWDAGLNLWVNTKQVVFKDVITQGLGDSSNKAMSQKAVTRELTELDSRFVNTIAASNDTDLDIKDNNGYVLARFTNGGFQTKNFNSVNTPYLDNTNIADLDITDESGYVLARLSDGHIKTKNFNSANTANKTVIRILSISNSYGCDALSFVPQIMKGLGCQIECAVAYHAGASLYQHYANISSNFYTYWYTDEQIWKSESSKSLEYIVKAQNWDYIIFQQGSSDSGKFDTYEPYLSNLIKYVSGLIDHKTKICFNMTQPYALGYSGLSVYSDSQDVMYASIEDAAKNVYTSVGIETIIPVGIAVQLARQTTLNSYGSYSQGQLSSDGTHLDGGIGRLVAGYTWIMALLRDKLNLSIWNSHFYPSRSMGLVLPDDNRGSWVDVTEDMAFIAKQCACKAVNKIYTILNNN